MEQQQNLFGGVDPEIQERVASRRDALFGMSRLGMTLAAASVPVAIAAMAKSAFGQTLPTGIVQALNFALTLEYLEAEFYTRGVASGVIPGGDQAIFTTIRDHENQHVAFLQQVLGSQAVAKPTFDFTGGNGANNGPFSPFTSYAQFLVLAQGFEDTGVRAYKGQAPNLMSIDSVLQAALQIHSVEARHAAEVRRLRGQRAGTAEQAPYKGWITLAQVDAAAAPIQAVYNAGVDAANFPAESNTVQGGLNVATLTGQTAASAGESFDEPLDMARVLQIVDPFIAG
ncbi:MAG TPA: ferritin-like domain-containing protein [Longimicrobium sp.]|nr:ferritin-like domain-containing protein [Longimicrobium sp.]